MPAGTLADLQSMIDALPKDGAHLRIPAGEYTGDGNLLFSNFSLGEDDGTTTIEMDGVRLSGGGQIIVDSCKWLTLTGARARKRDLTIRGCWWANLNNLQTRQIVFAGEGERFSSTYWNSVRGGMTQRLVFHENMAAPTNGLWLYGTCIRSKAGQGYVDNYAYSIGFRAPHPVKDLRFYGGDISYASSSDWVIGSLASTIDCVGHGVFFDSGRPYQTLDEAGPLRRLIKWENKDNYNWAEA